MAWEDVKNMLEEEVMTEAALKNAWKEAAKGALKITEISLNQSLQFTNIIMF